jgi:glycosyltransferase involved in cell wall biosynthesis
MPPVPRTLWADSDARAPGLAAGPGSGQTVGPVPERKDRTLRVALSNSSWKWGGVHLVTERLVAGLHARGHNVLLLCRPGSELEARMRDAVPIAPVLKGPDLGPAAMLRCARALRQHRSDVVLCLMDKDLRLTGIAARRLRLPVVVRRANDQPLRSRFARFFYRRVATHIVVNSEATRASLLASAPELSVKPIDVIYNGIRIDVYANAEPAVLGLPAETIKLGFIGRFETRKGLRELLDAWPGVASQVNGAHLFFVGKGPLELELRARLSHDPRVHFLGYRSDVPELLAAFDVIVMPSHWEGFGLVAAEAMAAARPVIAANASSLRELIRDGVNGRMVPPGDSAALALAMIELARDPALRSRLGSEGRRIAAQEFSEQRMIDRWTRLLERVAGTAG